MNLYCLDRLNPGLKWLSQLTIFLSKRQKLLGAKFLQPNSWTQFPTIPISRLGGWAGISSLPQYEVQFGLYSLPSRSMMKVFPQNQKAYCQVLDWSGLRAIMCMVVGRNMNVVPAPPWGFCRVRAVQGPYESGAKLFSCIFQLLKFPRRATCANAV